MLHDPSAYLPRTHRLPFAPSTCPLQALTLHGEIKYTALQGRATHLLLQSGADA